MREDLRETILASSAELFLSQGFKATSTRQIAKKSGLLSLIYIIIFRIKKNCTSLLWSIFPNN